MTKHVLGYRTDIELDEYAFYLGADDLNWLIDEGHSAAKFWPDRQFAIFTRHPPRQWWTSKRRYIFGASDNDLYRHKYGEDMPIPSSLGRIAHGFDHHFTGGTK